MQAAIDWLQQLGTSGNEAGNAVVVDGDNNYIYVGGYTTGALSDDGSASEYWNPWVAKFYAKSGEQIWSKQLSDVTDASDFTGSDIAIDDDNVYVLIQDRENDKTLVVKLDLDAEEEKWTYDFKYASGSVDNCNSIVADGSGYLYITGTVAGSMISPDDEVLESTGVKDAWIAKLSTDKELNWIKQFGSSESESYGMDLAVDGSGNVYAVGYTTGVMIGTTDVSNSESSEDIWIAKYNSDGERQWIEQLGSVSNENERALAVAVDEFGGVYATGITQGDLKERSTTKYTNIQSWVAKFQTSTETSKGEQVWLNQFGDEGADTFEVKMRGISVDNNGGVYIAGRINGDGTLADLSTDPVAIASTSRDALIIKYNAYTGKRDWLKQINSSDDMLDNARNITVGPNGNLYLTGVTAGEMSGTTTPQQGGDDIWLAQLREVPENYDELAQVLKRYIDYKVSQSTETVLETSETTSTTSTTTSSSITTSSLLEVAADVVASNNSGSNEEESKQTTESDNSVSVLSEATSVANS